MTEGTLDRDVRFSPEQITFTQGALRREIRRRTKSIEKAEASRAAGATIQHGMLDEHYRAREAARAVLENLEVARKQIAHRIATQVGAAS